MALNPHSHDIDAPRPSMLESLRRRLLDPGLGPQDVLSLTDAILALQRASLAR